jgi:hypothetical protein
MDERPLDVRDDRAVQRARRTCDVVGLRALGDLIEIAPRLTSVSHGIHQFTLPVISAMEY